jgi:hypothetical protein
LRAYYRFVLGVPTSEPAQVRMRWVRPFLGGFGGWRGLGELRAYYRFILRVPASEPAQVRMRWVPLFLGGFGEESDEGSSAWERRKEAWIIYKST